MATTTKLSFRARALDSNKAMCVYYASELPDASDCTPIARAVAPMPTGMEKEEEMESHLQDAILAQQASTSGLRVDNHVIPTPKVFPVHSDRYDQIYPQQPSPKNQYIKVQAWLPLDNDEADYDVDSEDERWLSDKPHIDPRTLERIFDTLEAQSSDNNICLPTTARSVLTSYDEGIVDDVYDYWLAKREEATTSSSYHLGVGGLIPRVRTECRKDTQGVINPYVAFRRRAEKMQTRKNRKNDEDSYEKVLKLSLDLTKTVTLFDMVKRREKTKLALIDLDKDILVHRMGLSDFGSPIFNQFVAKLKPEAAWSWLPRNEQDDEAPKKKKRSKIRPPMTTVDREIPNKAWLKKNAEVWNRPPTAFNPHAASPLAEVDRCAQAANDAVLDGRYTFKRRRGCVYRAPKPVCPIESSLASKVPPERHLYHVSLPSSSGSLRPPVAVRRRIGRGGRVIYDRVVAQDQPRVPKVFDPFDDEFLEKQNVSFVSKVHSHADDALPAFSRPIFDDSAQEEWWLANERIEPTDDRLSEEPASKAPSISSHSGNGLTGRVDHTSESLKTPAEVTSRPASNEWREGSGSPSGSNSSAEWTPPSLGARIAAFAMISEEEARTGEHPIAIQPSVKKEFVNYFDPVALNINVIPTSRSLCLPLLQNNISTLRLQGDEGC